LGIKFVTMIDSVVETVANELNEFFRLKFGIIEDRVVVSNIVNQDGSAAIKDDNRVILSLVMIQEEKMGAYKSTVQISPGGVKPVYLNLFLLFSASFNEKLNVDALKFISAVIAFFQNKPVFNQQNSSTLADGLEKLSFEILNMSIQEQSNLWSTLGAKYLPSIMYKVRVVTIDEKMLVPETVEVTGMERNLNQ
jgi:hypothetical protein